MKIVDGILLNTKTIEKVLLEVGMLIAVLLIGFAADSNLHREVTPIS